MSDETSRSERDQRRMPSKDITPVLKGWDYESGTINVRKINGIDGTPKLQMRLDLGLLQMEMSGRPDGAKPHGYESLLDYFEAQLAEHKKTNGSDLGFHLSTEQCQSLREESLMYYQRYLSLFVLEEFAGVVRDTSRNLRLLDLCSKFAMEEQDKLVLEQYRPYITMMNARASAYLTMCGASASRVLIVAAVSDLTLMPSVPLSGLASMAITRSPRNEASVLPSAAVVVVFPTPPLRLMTAILW